MESINHFAIWVVLLIFGYVTYIVDVYQHPTENLSVPLYFPAIVSTLIFSFGELVGWLLYWIYTHYMILG